MVVKFAVSFSKEKRKDRKLNYDDYYVDVWDSVQKRTLGSNYVLITCFYMPKLTHGQAGLSVFLDGF